MITPDKTWKTMLMSLLAAPEYSPRGMLCYERLSYSSIINMSRPILLNPVRKLGYRFMAAEAYWILTGDNQVENIAPYSKRISEFSDDGVTFFGAYGPKIKDQINYVVDALTKDSYTRQAVMTIWRENPPPSKDIPCTISVQWVVRDGFLNCLDTMRSSDVWLGWPYDIFNFSMLSIFILLELRERCMPNLELGYLYLTAGSQHLYRENVEDAKLCIEYKVQDADTISIHPGYFNSSFDFLNWLSSMRERPMNQFSRLP